MAVLPLPYMVPLFLGMTFDARNSTPGVSIFDDNYVDNPDCLCHSDWESTYAYVTSHSELSKALDISGELALKIKTGNLNVKGSGSYIKNNEDMEDSVIILFIFKYTSRVKEMRSGHQPRSDWLSFSKSVLGTHYVRSITYGVKMVAALKFTATESSSKQTIKAEVSAALKHKPSGLSGSISGKLNDIVSDMSKKSRMELSYFGTLPLKIVPNSIESLQKLISTFREDVHFTCRDRSTCNSLKGDIPLSVELHELTRFSSEIPDYNVKKETNTRFESFQNAFFSLSEARDRLYSWSRSLPFDLSERSSREIGNLMTVLNDDLNKAYGILSRVDLTVGESTLAGDEEIVGKGYSEDVRRLIARIDKEAALNAQVTTYTYIHWGNNTCPGDNSVKIVDGYTVGSTKEGVGGMAKYDCMPHPATGETYQLNNIGHESSITGINFGKVLRRQSGTNVFNGSFATQLSDSIVPCARCHQTDASTVSMFSATSNCPPSWHLKYTGYLMSGATADAHTTQYICVDAYPTKSTSLRVDDMKSSIALTLVRTEGSLPKTYIDDRLVPCAVCALKGGLHL